MHAHHWPAGCPACPEWDAKNQFGLHIWESADAAGYIRGRLRELRNYQPERGLSPSLEQVAAALDRAQNTAEVIATVYLVSRKALLHAYRNHPEVTWSDFDNPTVKVTEALIAQTEAQVAWAEGAFPAIAGRYPDWEAWQDTISRLLASDGGVMGTGPNGEPDIDLSARPLLLPWTTCQRMPDWPIFNPDEDIEPNRKADPEGHRLWRFKHYLNEMTASETLGSILWMTPEMPWEYQHNVARHLWDEIRHSQLGQTRIQQLGLKIEDVPQVVQIYNVMMTLPAVDQVRAADDRHRAERHAEKRANREHWEDIHDDISAAAVSYDWATRTSTSAGSEMDARPAPKPMATTKRRSRSKSGWKPG